MAEIASPAKQDNQDQAITPQILANLMNSLQRVFKIAVYYPDGHHVADQTIGSFSHALNRVVGKKETTPPLTFFLSTRLLYMSWVRTVIVDGNLKVWMGGDYGLNG